MMSQEALHSLVNTLSETYFDKPFVDDVVFNYRLRTTGGRYIPRYRRIELNPKYLIELGEAEFHGIIKHELCHYHLHIEGKGYQHGDESFKALLKATGSPRHCAQLPSDKKAYQHTYVCESCKHVYRRKRRVNLQRYRCGKCRGQIKKRN